MPTRADAVDGARDPRFGWHRVFHPLCGADLGTLLRLIARHGPPAPSGAGRVAVALACALARLPFTAAERVWTAGAVRRAGPPPAPVFIVGHMRSGTTHLHNLLAAAGLFGTVPPVLAALPWEALGLARVLRPFVEPYLPRDRLIDRMRVLADSPTEDELALANMHTLSYYHALYFPRRFEATYRDGLLLDDGDGIARWQQALRHYVDKMAMLSAGRPLLLKNPAYTAQIGTLRALWPDARFIHIHRDPYVVFESTRRTLKIVLRELALQKHDHVPVDEIVLAMYPLIMRRLLADAERLPEGALVHVRFEDLERQPLDEVERIFRVIRFDGYRNAVPAMQRYLDAVRGYQKSTVTPGPETIRRVARRWQPIVNRLGYAAPALV